MTSDRRVEIADGAGGGANSIDQVPDARYLSPFLVVQYIEQYRDRLKYRRFSAIPPVDDEQEIEDIRYECLQDTAVGSSIMPHWHWGGQGATDSLCHLTQTNSWYVCCFEEIRYDQQVWDTLQRLTDF